MNLCRETVKMGLPAATAPAMRARRGGRVASLLAQARRAGNLATAGTRSGGAGLCARLKSVWVGTEAGPTDTWQKIDPRTPGRKVIHTVGVTPGREFMKYPGWLKTSDTILLLSQDCGGTLMVTPSIPEKPQPQRAEVKWPVTLLTPHGPIEGETEYIGLSRILVVSKTSLPSEGDIGLLIQAPNHGVVHMTSEVVCKKAKDSDHNITCFSVELQITYVSEADKEFLGRIIASNPQRRTARSVQRLKTASQVPAGASAKPNSESDTLDVQLPAFYKQGGKMVAAHATRFSPQGCLVLTKKPHRVGTVFSLKITNPKSKKSIQVDGLVSLRKLSSAKKRWGMLIQFLNLTKTDREEMRQVLTDPGQTPKASIKSKYLDTFRGFVLNILPK